MTSEQSRRLDRISAEIQAKAQQQATEQAAERERRLIALATFLAKWELMTPEQREQAPARERRIIALYETALRRRQEGLRCQ
jgi:hypothetical protein